MGSIFRGVAHVLALLVISLVASACGGDGSSTTDTTGSTSGGDGCTAATCVGCCFNGACQGGTTAAGCGKGGATCSTCSAPDICTSEQICAVDPASMWIVQPTAAMISTTNNGASWDPGGGAPDPFVNLYCPASAAAITSATPFVSDTFTPTWTTGGCTMSAKDLMAAGVGIEVWDDDNLVNDLIAAKGTIVVTEEDLRAGAITGITNKTTLISLSVSLKQK